LRLFTLQYLLQLTLIIKADYADSHCALSGVSAPSERRFIMGGMSGLSNLNISNCRLQGIRSRLLLTICLPLAVRHAPGAITVKW
jgi:hypothetical protein